MSRAESRPSRPDRQADAAGGLATARRCLRWYLAGLALLGPLKFGSIIGPSEIALFPASLLEWVFGSWPAFLLGPLAGLGLGAALWLYPGSLRRHPARLALGAWTALLVSCLPGLMRTGEWDTAVTFVLYLAGVCAYLAAVLLATGVDPGFRRALLGSIVVGTLCSGLLGWHQRLWGFEEMRRYAEAQMRETGQPWSAAMQGKLEQRRVHRPFFHPNSYAAHLVLTGPLVLLALWRAGRRVEPRRLSQPLFVAIGAVVVVGALLLSGSRSAQLGVGAGLGLAILGSRGLRRWRWPLLFGAILLGGGLMALVNAGRDLLSASARFDYYRAALVMFREHPLTGVGLGEFLSAYLQIKPAGAEETRAAHNLILEMLSQAGLWGGLAALGCALMPFWLSLSRPGGSDGSSDEGLRLAGVAGLGAWVAHAMLDFNLQIPPTVMLAAVVPVLCRPSPTAVAASRLVERLLLVCLAALATAGFWRVPGEWRLRRLADDADGQSLAGLRESTARAASALPLSPAPWAFYGRRALHLGQASAAVEAYDEALRRAPHRSALWAWRAQASLMAGDIEAAEAAARQAWTLYPTSDRAILLSAVLGALQSDMAPAASHPQVWLRTALASAVHVDEDSDGLVARLSAPPAAVFAGVSTAALCERFNALGLRTPEAAPRAVRFVPEQGPAADRP